MVQEICNLFAQDAPEITKKFPAGFGDTGHPPTYLDFIKRLGMEVLDILERGDSIVEAEDIPFSGDDWATVMNAWKNIENLSNGNTSNISEQLENLPIALQNIHKFYTLRVEKSLNRASKHEGELDHFQKVTKQSLLNQGDEGYAKLFGGFDETLPDHLQGDTVDLAEYNRWKKEQDELLSDYNGASELNPALLGIGGRPPEEIEIEDKIAACGQDEQRHKETAFEILTLINKMRAIGLSAQPSHTSHYAELEI